MDDVIKINHRTSYNKLKLQLIEKNNTIKDFLKEMEKKEKQNPKLTSSPNRIKSTYLNEKKINLELKENSTKYKLNQDDDISSANLMFQEKKKLKTGDNFFLKGKSKLKQEVEKNKFMKKEFITNVVIKMKNALIKSKEILENDEEIKKKINKKNAFDYKSNISLFQIKHIYRHKNAADKNFRTKFKRGTIYNKILKFEKFKPKNTINFEEDQFDLEMNKEINKIIEDEYKKEELIKKKLILAKNKQKKSYLYENRSNSMSPKMNIMKSKSLLVEQNNLRKKQPIELNPIIEISNISSKKIIETDPNKNETCNSNYDLLTYGSMINFKNNKLSILNHQNTVKIQNKKINTQTFSKHFEYNSHKKNLITSSNKLQLTNQETLSTHVINTNSTIDSDKMNSENNQRRIDEEMLSLDLLHNYRRISKQLDNERMSKFFFKQNI